MIKTFFTLLCALVLFQAVQAKEADSLVYYYKNGKKLPSKDSAEFYRVILLPDTNIDKDLYRVYDYYPDGKTKRVATSLTATPFPVLDGYACSIIPMGKEKRFASIKMVNL